MHDSFYYWRNGCWLYRNHFPSKALKAKGHKVPPKGWKPKIKEEFENKERPRLGEKNLEIKPPSFYYQLKELEKKKLDETINKRMLER